MTGDGQPIRCRDQRYGRCIWRWRVRGCCVIAAACGLGLRYLGACDPSRCSVARCGGDHPRHPGPCSVRERQGRVAPDRLSLLLLGCRRPGGRAETLCLGHQHPDAPGADEKAQMPAGGPAEKKVRIVSEAGSQRRSSTGRGEGGRHELRRPRKRVDSCRRWCGGGGAGAARQR